VPYTGAHRNPVEVRSSLLVIPTTAGMYRCLRDAGRGVHAYAELGQTCLAKIRRCGSHVDARNSLSPSALSFGPTCLPLSPPALQCP